MMKKTRSVEEYIENPHRKEELQKLRDILTSTELEEGVKWGTPHYMIDGKNVVGIAAFKSYVGLWFHQGVFLKDKANKLVNAQEGTTKGLRQWRFQSIDQMDGKLIKQYVEEAIANQKKGLEVKPEKKKVAMPEELSQALAGNTELKSQFESLTPGKQKEYKEHIGSAKQEKTRLNRLEKAVPLILQGIGLNDKYR